MKQRKRGIRRKLAGAMAALMVLSAVNVSGWGVMNAKAEETAVGTTPQYLTIGSTKIIDNGDFQEDGISDNDDTIYQGINWYYDSTKNQLVLENASISGHITSMNGDLSIILSGTNNMRSEMLIQSISTESGIVPTLEINGNNHNGSLSCGTISVGDDVSNNNNLNIIGATLETSEIDCSGIVTIENSHVVANDDSSTVISGDKINIVDSFVEAKATTERYEGKVIRSNQPINVSGSQIVVSRALDCSDPVLSDCSFSNSVITKKWKDYKTKDNVTKTYVYGTAALKEDLTIASGESIEFESGASITNPEKLTLADGASLLVNGEEHTHNKDGDVTYTWKDDKEHIKNVACKDCPIGYVTKETESHSIGENGFCACNEVYQPAKLTTDKYDIDGDDSKDAVYEISNAGQLYWFAGLVNGTLSGETQNKSANAVLTADIVVNENVLKSDGTVNEGTFKEWTPIGIYFYKSYGGIFDGQNHTISGLYFSQGDKMYLGLFGINAGKISNVGILDSYFCGKVSVGGVCGYNFEGTITNCYNAGSVSGTENYVGGVSGDNSQGIITNCYNVGSVSGAENCYVGGVSGENYNGTIANCYNAGSVSGTENYVGGVSGENDNGTITNCYYDSTIYTGNAIGDDTGTTTKVEGKTTDEFKTGEVAYLLQLDQSEEVWGQTIGKDTYPTLGGAKVYKNATYNGCVGKPGDAVSYAYSNTKKNTYGDHQDADNDGKCDSCGAIIDGIGAKLAGYSLSLTGNIGVNFYMELSDDVVNDESAYMSFTLPNGTTSKVYVSGTHEDGSTAATDTTVKDGVTYYVFTCEVAAKEMTSDIKAQMIGNNGEKTGKVYTYTVKEYADYILSHTSAEDNYGRATVLLVKGMLNYGGAAQKYFGYKTDQLASDGLALTEPVFDDTSIINFIKDEANKASITNYSDSDKVTFKSAYLSLNSTTDLCVYVQFAEDVTVQEDMFAILLDSKEISKDQYEITKVNEENCYKITLHGIKASQLQKQYEFEVALPDTGPAVLKYGATSYAYTVMSSACDNINNIESLREAVKALHAYGSCAQGYEYYKNKN
ncbi:MAG: GLUG motif-containing protein [Clostridium sp.]